MDRIKNEIQQRTVQVKMFLESLIVKTTVPQAAAKGSLLFFSSAVALYACGVLLFVAFKWNSPWQQQSSQIIIPSHWPPLDQHSIQRLLRDPEATLQHMDQQIQHIRDLVEQHHEIFSSARSHLESLQLELDNAATNPVMIPKLMRRHPSTVHLTKRAPHLTVLLQALPDKLENAYPTPEELNEGILLAIRELQDLVEDETTPWDQFTAWLQAPYWKSLRWESFQDKECAAADMPAPNDNSTTLLSPNDQAWVDELVQAVRDSLKQRSQDPENNGWQATLDDTRDELEEFYQDKVSIALSQLKYLASKYKRGLKKKTVGGAGADKTVVVSTHDCPMTEDKIVAMVEAGLDAIYRKKDLRQAIIGSSDSSGDAEDSYIILDAVLDEPWKPPRSPYPETVNLRQMVDKPVLKLVAKWIDGTFDRMGGYSDYIDSKIDSLTNGNNDAGSVVTDSLLRLASKFSVPVPLGVQTRKMAERAT